MAAPTIIDGSKHFSTVLHEGTGTGQKVGKFVPFTNNATISKAVRFNYEDTPKLISAALGTPSSDKIFTFSCWFKVGQLSQQYQGIFSTSTDNSGNGGNVTRYAPLCVFNQNSAEKNPFGYDYQSSGYIWYYSMNNDIDLEDVSQWHHFHMNMDTTQSTDSDRMKIYIDGNQITAFSSVTYPSLNAELATTKSGYYHDIGLGYNKRFEGCLAEINLCDGQTYGPDTFGLTDTSTGNWIPKSLGSITYGNNGFRAQFANTAGQTLGYVTGGGTANNFFTATNMDSTDCVTDTPTSNHMVFDQQITTGSGSSIYEAGTEVNFVSGSGYTTVGTAMLIPNSGKWYWEIKCTTSGSEQGLTNPGIGVIDTNQLWAGSVTTGRPFIQVTGGMGSMFYSGFRFCGLDVNSGTQDFTIGSDKLHNNDYMVIAMDMDNGKGYWGWYDASAGGSITWFASDGGEDGNPSTGANPTVTFDPKAHRFQVAQGSYAPGSYPGTFAYNFGSRPFNFTAPTDFKGLSQDQFPETGDFDFIPDVVWTKNRDATDSHAWYDSTRGIKNRLQTDTTSTESVVHDGLQKFLKGGYETLQNHENNAIDESYVSFMWKAGGGTTSANSDGSGASIASTIQKNEDAGFSIVSYSGSGTGSSVAGKVAHGLSQTPECIWIKSRTAGNNWVVYHHKISDPSDKVLYLNDTNAETNWPYMGDTDPTNKVFTISSDLETGRASNTYMAYCWYGIEGYSKFGTYEGNNNNDGTFVYLGFKPALLIVKNLDGAYGWRMYNNATNPRNPMSNTMLADISTAENTSTYTADFLSNGFKQRDTYSSTNAGNSYVYMAWAEHPFVGTGTNPVTAR